MHPDALAFDAITTMADQFTQGRGLDDTMGDRGRNRDREGSGAGGDSDSGDTGGGPGGNADTAPAPNGKRAKTRGARPLAVIVVHISYAAYLRGYTCPGEICEIEGAGPITVPTAYRLASDSVMKAVVKDGVDISLISHLGRTISAHLRTGVEVRDRTCVIAGCEIDRHRDIDHKHLRRRRWPHQSRQPRPSLPSPPPLTTLRDLRRTGPHGNQELVTKQEHEQTRIATS